jgi:hypothetical protein
LIQKSFFSIVNKLMERVSAIKGNNPVLVIAPHGADGDDDYTALITEVIADTIGAFAVINRGWQRAEDYDYSKEHANCNNVVHCHQDVVKGEFLDPILRFTDKIRKDHGEVNVFIIHGVGNDIRKKANDMALDAIVGYGNGKPPSYSCELTRKTAFIYIMNNSKIKTYEGKAGSQYSGKSKVNLNQLFNHWYPDDAVNSMQLEIVKELREDDEIAKATGEAIGDCITKYLKFIANPPEEGWEKYIINSI